MFPRCPLLGSSYIPVVAYCSEQEVMRSGSAYIHIYIITAHTTDESTNASCVYIGEMTKLTITTAAILLLCCTYFWR